MSSNPEDADPGGLSQRSVTLAALYESDDEAMDAVASVNAALEEAAAEVDLLFAKNGGVAESAQVDRIYARFGLRNTSGWRQERPLEADGRRVLWQLPPGASPEDAELVLLSHGASAVEAVEPAGGGWKVAPHPLAIPFVDEESGEVFYDVVNVDDGPARSRSSAPKRTLH
jgi:hypothetical protein